MTKNFKKLGVSALALVGFASVVPSVFAAGETLESADISTLMVTEVGVMSTQGYLVLAATATIIIALILWKFAVRKAKGAVR